MIMQPTKTFKVRSQTNKNIVYDVNFYEDGSAVCDCKYYQFRGYKRGLGQCKHIDFLRKKYFNK